VILENAALQNLLACPPLTLIIDNNGRSYSEGNHNRSVVRAAKTLARYARAKSGVLELTDNSGLPGTSDGIAIPSVADFSSAGD
jgi:hypothetical protein